MRRIARHLFTILSALSLLLCVGTCVLWVRSYSVWDEVVWDARNTYGSTLSIASLRGRVNLSLTREDGRQASKSTWMHQSRSADDGLPPRWLPLLRFAHHSTRFGTPVWKSLWAVDVPYWALCAVFGSSLVVQRGYCRSRKRRHAGRCPTCGYDLRASPERCPECGTANPTTAVIPS